MLKIKLHNKNLDVVGEQELKKEVFAVEVNKHLVHHVVLAQNQWHRESISNTKGRSDVRGGGKKPYKQKGTGTARRGSQRSPIMIGGGIVFGPKPRTVSYKVNKKEMQIAVKSTLTDKLMSQKIFLVDELAFDKPSSKQVTDLMKKLAGKNNLFVDVNNVNLKRSVSNQMSSKYLEACGLNVYDMLKYENLVLTKASLTFITEKYAK